LEKKIDEVPGDIFLNLKNTKRVHYEERNNYQFLNTFTPI